MKFKKTFLIACMIICIFFIAGVSAGDADNQTITSADDLELSKNCEMDYLQTYQETQIVSGKDNGTFQALSDKIRNASPGSTVKLENDYSYVETYFTNGIEITKANITIDGQGHTIDARKWARIFFVHAENVTLKNITFKNAHAISGGAIEWYNSCGGCVSGCSFVGNTADYGGAILWYWSDGGCVSGCSFVGNTADSGSAIYWEHSGGCVSDCNFVNNLAKRDYAYVIYWNNGDGGYISLCSFTNNSAGGVAIYCSNTDVFVDSCIYRTGSNKNYNTRDFAPNLSVDNFTSLYNSGEKLTFDLKTNRSAPITNADITIEVYKNNTLFGTYHCLSGDGWAVDLPVGSYNAIFKTEFAGFEPVNRTLTINKMPSKITASSPTAIYSKDKYMVVSLRDANDNPVSGVQITVNLNGAKTYTTDRNGQVKVNIAKLVPKTYNAVITFENVNYYPSKATSKVVVKKATPKITAKKKTFKKSSKIKKYTVTLKSGKNPIKKAKLTLKIKGKTYKAKTNKKGKAIFKIKKLTKKGKYKAVIKFKANKYYKKVTKKVKITIK